PRLLVPSPHLPLPGNRRAGVLPECWLLSRSYVGPAAAALAASSRPDRLCRDGRGRPPADAARDRAAGRLQPRRTTAARLGAEPAEEHAGADLQRRLAHRVDPRALPEVRGGVDPAWHRCGLAGGEGPFPGGCSPGCIGDHRWCDGSLVQRDRSDRQPLEAFLHGASQLDAAPGVRRQASPVARRAAAHVVRRPTRGGLPVSPMARSGDPRPRGAQAVPRGGWSDATYMRLAWLCLALAVPLRLAFFAGFGLGDDPNESQAIAGFANSLRLDPNNFM